MEAKCVPTLGATVLIGRYLIRELLLNDRLLAILCSMVLIAKQPAASFCGKRSNAVNGRFKKGPLMSASKGAILVD